MRERKPKERTSEIGLSQSDGRIPADCRRLRGIGGKAGNWMMTAQPLYRALLDILWSESGKISWSGYRALSEKHPEQYQFPFLKLIGGVP